MNEPPSTWRTLSRCSMTYLVSPSQNHGFFICSEKLLHHRSYTVRNKVQEDFCCTWLHPGLHVRSKQINQTISYCVAWGTEQAAQKPFSLQQDSLYDMMRAAYLEEQLHQLIGDRVWIVVGFLQNIFHGRGFS